MKGILNPNNPFFKFMNKVADLILLNLLCIICCLPIVTIGPSITAMFYVTLKMVRNEESYIFKGFFHSFKENFKQGIVIHVIMAIVAATLCLDMYFCWHIQSSLTICKIFFGLFCAIAILYLMVFIYIYPLLARFSNSTRNLFLNAFLMSIRHLPQTILMMALTVIPLILMFSHSILLEWGVMLYALLGFAAIAYANSFLFTKIFDLYTPKSTSPSKQVGEGAIEASIFKNLQPTNPSSHAESIPSDAAEETTKKTAAK